MVRTPALSRYSLTQRAKFSTVSSDEIIPTFPTRTWPSPGFAKRFRQSLNQFVSVEAVAVALQLPVHIRGGAECCFEGCPAYPARRGVAQIGDMRVIAAVAQFR